ncbi:MAG: hypothetical protein Phyf2KO_23470 [Phycisphaerales bacterium]
MLVRSSVVVLVGTFSVGAAEAQPVRYSLVGTGTGHLDGVQFFDTAFEIVLSGDLNQIGVSPGGNPQILDIGATIAIDGISSGSTFLPQMSLVSNLNTNRLIFGNQNSNSALAIMDNDAFVGYELGADFGPVSDDSIDAVHNFSGQLTSDGLLGFGVISTMTFTATLVPTPASAMLFGAAGLCAARRRR